MTISNLVFSNRSSRIALVGITALASIGWLFVDSSTALRILGLLTALLLVVAIKTCAELFVQLRAAKEKALHAMESAAQSKRSVDESRAELDMARQRLTRLEAAMFEERGAFSQERQRTEARIRELRSEMSKTVKELSTRVDQLANRSGTRRHRETTESFRELGLRDSLAGLSRPEASESTE
ncbi:MAG TPA: hypothetical protein VI193_03240 [Acidimicrobiia bacterium]